LTLSDLKELPAIDNLSTISPYLLVCSLENQLVLIFLDNSPQFLDYLIQQILKIAFLYTANGTILPLSLWNKLWETGLGFQNQEAQASSAIENIVTLTTRSITLVSGPFLRS
jgi:hypothetical protein